MKDKNGKTLRKGDVCVFYEETENDWAIEHYDGLIVEFLSKEGDMARTQDVREKKNGLWFFYCFPNCLEIIGDVR